MDNPFQANFIPFTHVKVDDCLAGCSASPNATMEIIGNSCDQPASQDKHSTVWHIDNLRCCCCCCCCYHHYYYYYEYSTRTNNQLLETNIPQFGTLLTCAAATITTTLLEQKIKLEIQYLPRNGWRLTNVTYLRL